MEFQKNGFCVIVNKNKNESYDEFYKRGWFIVSQQGRNETFEQIMNFSNMYIQSLRGCRYHPDDMKIMKKMEKKCYEL